MSNVFTNFWNKYGEKIISVTKGALIAGVGAGCTYLLAYFGAIQYSSPEQAVAVAAGLSVLANALRKFGIPVIYGISDAIRGV